MVVLDIDGTICPVDAYSNPSAHRTVSPGVRAAVTGAIRSATAVVLGTGRAAPATIPFLHELGIHSGRAICSNGAVIIDVESGIVLRCESFELARPVQILRERLPGAVFVAENPGTGVLATAPTDDSDMHFGTVQLVEVDELASSASTRLAVHWPGRSSDDLATALSAVVLPGVRTWMDPGDTFADLTAADVSKACAAEFVRGEFGIPRAQTLAIGDGINDIELLRWAGLGIAMGHAPDCVRDAADAVCPPVEDDGVAHVLSRWFGA
ncbi:HAD-IIB family hydrolase [Nocardia sp. NBC_01730]|nr:HAD-IIB family hydrolase [Nocardia sp. NBC_01730]